MPTDIVNRALQRVGVPRIVALTDDDKSASEANACYDKLRRAELRRNPWRFAMRRSVIRPYTLSTMNVVFPAFDNATAYPTGAVVTSAGQAWQAPSPIGAGAGNPEVSAVWKSYFGPLTADLWDNDTAYFAGDLIYTPQSTSYGVYMSLTSGNEDDPTAIAAWSATAVYMIGDTVSFSAQFWQSKVDLNVNISPTAGANWLLVTQLPDQRRGQNWLRVVATLTAPNILYPVGTGPAQQSNTKNVFRLPSNYLRKAPQDPKAGSATNLGSPTNRYYDDWLMEGNYLISCETNPIVFRFVADITNVSEMDDSFCEALGARIALELCEPLTQSTAKVQACGAQYKLFMMDARNNSALENDALEPPMDEFLAVRLR